MTNPKFAIATLALSTLLACGGGGGNPPPPPPPKSIADTLVYTNPSASGSYQLIKDTASTPGHLMLDLVGPASTNLSGVGFYLTADSTKVTWSLLGSDRVVSSFFSSTIIKSKVTGDTLQAGVYQKGTTPAVTTTGSTVLATIVLDLKSNIPVNTSISLSAPTGKAILLNPPGPGQATTPISIVVGSLVAN